IDDNPPAVGSKLDGVDHQVQQKLFQSVGVAVDPHRHEILNVQLQIAVLNQHSAFAVDLTDQRIQIKRGQFQLHTAVIGAGQQQQIAVHARHALDFAFNRL